MGLLHDRGELGEKLAEKWLRENGFVILDRRWRVCGGEIDIIARKEEKVRGGSQMRYFFVEVKLRTTEDPAETVDNHKIVMMERTAMKWLEYLDDDEVAWSLSAIFLTPKDGKDWNVEWIEDLGF